MTTRRFACYVALAMAATAGLSLSTLAVSSMQNSHCPGRYHHALNKAAEPIQPRPADKQQPYADYILQHKRHAHSDLHSLTRYNVDRHWY